MAPISCCSDDDIGLKLSASSELADDQALYHARIERNSMLKKKKLVALLAAICGLPIMGCLAGGANLDTIADLLVIIDHFEGQIPGF